MPHLPDPRQVVEQVVEQAQAALGRLRGDVDSAAHGGSRSDGTPWRCPPETLRRVGEGIAMSESLLGPIVQWLPYFEICFPLPEPKKPQPRKPPPPELDWICGVSVPILILCTDVLVRSILALEQMMLCGCGKGVDPGAAARAGGALDELERQLEALRPHVPSLERTLAAAARR